MGGRQTSGDTHWGNVRHKHLNFNRVGDFVHKHTRLAEKLWVESSHSRGSPPLVRSRCSNSCTISRRSLAVKSGQRLGRKQNSAKAHSQSRKSERRCSPPVRIRRSTSVEPPR